MQTMIAAETYHPVRADIALAKIAAGQVPSEFCNTANPNVPSDPASLEHWAKADPEFAQRLQEARIVGARAMFDDCVRLSKDRSYRESERKLMIETKMKVAISWDPSLNPKSVIESTVTTRSVTAKEAYIQDMVSLYGMSPEQAASQYDSARPIVAMIR